MCDAAWSPAVTGPRPGRLAPSRPSRRVVGHQQRDGAHGDAGDAGRVGVVDQPAVEQATLLAAAVVAADPFGADLDADRRQAGIGHAAHRRVADDGGQADDRGGRGEDRLADAGHAEDRPDGHDRVARRDQDDVGGGDRLEHARCGLGVVDAHLHERAGGQRGTVLDPPLLEVDGPARAVEVDDDVGLAAVVGHRQQPDAGLPPLAQRRGHVGERVAGVEHPGADEVGRDVEVAQPEPRRLGAVGRQLVLDAPGLVLASPAALVVRPVAQRVHDAVQVGADAQAVQRDVVAGVDDRGELVVRGRPRGRRGGISRRRFRRPES